MFPRPYRTTVSGYCNYYLFSYHPHVADKYEIPTPRGPLT